MYYVITKGEGGGQPNAYYCLRGGKGGGVKGLAYIIIFLNLSPHTFFQGTCVKEINHPDSISGNNYGTDSR